MKKLLCTVAMLAALAVGQNPNTAVFPGSIATDNDLLVASNRSDATVSSTVGATDTTINVGATASFIVPTVITFLDNGEVAKCLSKTSTSFTSCTRGFDSAAGGIAATSHASGIHVQGFAVAYYINQHAAEIKALETAAASALTNPMTTLGDTVYENSAPAISRLPGNTTATKKFLTQTGTGVASAAPAWSTIVAADVPTLNQSTSGNAATATALAQDPTETGCSSIKTVTAIDTGANLTCTSIQLAAADGSQLGLAAFAAADFNDATGVISIDYANGQKATGSVPGFLSAADWNTFNGKQASGNYITALTGNVTASGPGSVAATIVSMPTGVTDAGYIAFTAITAPTTPAAGVGRVYVDSTSKNVSVKDDAGVVKHGVQTDTGTANQYISAISDAGAITKSRPACATLSDSGTGCSAAAGITQLTGDVTAGAGSGSVAATVVNLPTGVTQAGYLLQTGIAAPGAGASGKGRLYFDSTSLNIAVVNASGTVNHGVQTKASTTHNFLTAISDAGLVSAAQPDYSDLTGTPTLRYQTVQEEGSSLTQRATLNIIGPGTCADNSGSSRTDCTFPNRQITLGVGAGDIGTTGVKACSVVRAGGTILGAYLIANAVPTGAALTVDVMKLAFSSYTGSAAPTSITASATPSIATAASNPRYSDTTLTGWTTTVTTGDVVCVKVTSAPTGGATFASLTLEIQ